MIRFSFHKEIINTLTLGPNYAIGKPPKQYIKELIVDTESAIRQLDPQIQSSIRLSSCYEDQINPNIKRMQDTT